MYKTNPNFIFSSCSLNSCKLSRLQEDKKAFQTLFVAQFLLLEERELDVKPENILETFQD